ncbi:MAG: tRNA (adenosine(37)-N6)-dimethylallyltransferase MiaA [Deltaproteobacteria bacterium RIFOXYD12_FULL_57_12]|nr:MAG: tRNA (adenosine(37)-N6)-dimethylallyltransferase MiaA [Deltaproteobacteria bacterium RIFOXYD12_FULL_57_12]
MIATRPLLVLVGPTAIGKTDFSLRIAEEFSAEIVSVDSMQVYRNMDIGTAKPTREEQTRIPHHLIDIVDPDEEYTVGRFVEDARQTIDTITGNGKIPLLVGGTGMYFKGLFEGLFEPGDTPLEKKTTVREMLRHKLLEEGGRAALWRDLKCHDPLSADRIHPNDTQRLMRALEIFHLTGIPWSEHLRQQKEGTKTEERFILKLGLTCDRDELYRRINLRVQLMIDQGLLDEVRSLLQMGYHSGLKSMQSIGYRHMINYLDGVFTWPQAIELLARDTRRYAKRQYTWFRQDAGIQWYGTVQQKELRGCIQGFLKNNPS